MKKYFILKYYSQIICIIYMEINDFEKTTDENLVKLSLENQDNFSFIIDRYENKITRYIKMLGKLSNDDIEDLLQDIFIKVYKNLNNFNTDLKFSSWIYRIAHNEAINKFKRNRTIDFDFDDIDYFFKKISECIDCNKENIEINLDKKILKEKINKVFTKMDLKYKEILILKFIEDKDYKEISDILKKPTNTVGTLINRAKKQFKEIYGQE